MRIRKPAGLSLALVLSFAWAATHAADCEPTAGTLASRQGLVEIMSGATGQWRAATLGQTLCQGDTLRLGADSRATVSLVNEAVLRIDQNTTLRLIDIQTEDKERSWLELIEGALQSFSRKPRQLTVNTPYINGSIEGTEFLLRVDATEAQLIVLEGTVVAANDQGSVAVTGGSAVAAVKGQAPQPRIVLKPREQTHWALYYPPVLFDGGAASPELLRAAQLLQVGRVDEVGPLIDNVLAADPNAGKAYALRAVMAVVQNQLTQALADGEKAASLDEGAAGSIALSYAQQAMFRIESAREGMRAAASKHPNDALVWARLAELELMMGDRAEATDAARKAEALAPGLARSQLVLGFIELTAFRNERARAAFTRAIELDSADPLGHLGLGLAKISGGELDAGRHDIEVAVGLDGSSALQRAYLGKAYFEERRALLDGQQFSIAKELDPNDPTAFLYDGIRKQTENQPVAALDDLEQSIALNDNRAVYRGRLLLDKDRAARGASIARVYSDLGFTQQGVAQASRSLSTDPANAAAHRFLSDVYQRERRREIARVSELLQSQMLQDVNVAPVQPSTSEANLNVVTVGGPAGAGFNEFTPLFQRNQTQVLLSAQGGSQGTESAEAGVAGQYDRYSYSLGAFTYDTDGWRPNNALDQELYNVFAQAAVTESVNIQAEFRHRESTEGDLAFNFNPDDYVADKTITREQDTSRVGMRFSPTSASHYLLSYVHSDRDETLREVQVLPPVAGETTATNNQTSKDKSDQAEAQFLHARDTMNLVVGGAWSDSDRVDDTALSVDDTIAGNLLAVNGQTSLPTKDSRGYVYVNAQSAPTVTWTLGGTYQRFEQSAFEEDGFHPKLGVLWDARPDLRVRAAAFQVLKPALVNNRTLEPTQVAGFNQLFDDINGTKSKRYGLGLDWRASGDASAGVELSQRTLDEPLFDGLAEQWITEEREEQLHRLYVDWTASPGIALHGELIYDQYTSASGIATADANLPEEVETWSLPLSAGFFSPSGFFAGIGATYVDQTVRRSATATQASGEDQFVVVDASVGYRLPQRRGVISVAAKNLFDKQFQYQDDSYREFRDEPSTGPYFPVRMLMARFVLEF